MSMFFLGPLNRFSDASAWLSSDGVQHDVYAVAEVSLTLQAFRTRA